MRKMVQKKDLVANSSLSEADGQTGSHALPYFSSLLAGIIGCHFLLIAGLSFLHLLTYKADFDVAQFNRLFWSLLHTGVPAVMPSMPPLHKINWFGAVHFSPVFYLILPFYAAWPSAFLLQILHCACLSATAIPVALTLRRLKLDDKTVLALAGMLLFNPFYFDAGIWEFHEISLGCLLIACCYWALIAHHKTRFLIFAFLLLLTKEHFGLAVAGFGCLWWRRHREGRFGLLVALSGLAATFLIVGIVMPALNGGLVQGMLRGDAMPRYAWLKSDIKDILYNAIYLFFSSAYYNASGIIYLLALFFTAGFFPLLSPLCLLPGLADFATILLSSDPFPRFLAAYHSAALIPVLTIASGATIAHYRKFIPKALPFHLLLPAFLVGVNILLFPKNAITAYELRDAAPVVNFKLANRIKDIIGPSSVSVQSNLGFLLSSGPAELYPFPVNRYHTDYILLYLRHPYRVGYYRVFGDITLLPAGRHYEDVIHLLENSPEWGIALWQDNWLLLKRHLPDTLPVRAEIIRKVSALAAEANTVHNEDKIWTPVLP